MLRRSRISVRPNVKPTGRAAATPRETPRGNETPADLSNDAGLKAGGQEIIAEVKAASTVAAVESNGNAGSQSSDVTSQAGLSVNAPDVAGQSASSSSLSTRRKRFSVLPNINKPRSTPTSTLTSSKPQKSPVPTKSTPEVPPSSTHTSSDVSESPDKHESTQESASRPLPVSTKSLRSPAPKLPSSSVRNTSRTSRFPTKAEMTTEPTPDKALSTPEPAPKLPPAPLAPSDGKSKRRKPKPVTPTQDDVETSAIRLDEAESQSATQDAAAESACRAEEVHSDPAPASESQNEPVVQDGGDLNSAVMSKKPQQHVPLALRTLNDPGDRLRLARARKLRELLRKEMNKEKKKEKHHRPQTGTSECKKTKDHTKMTMRELIYYLPDTNPMKSYSDDEQRAETDFPPSPKAAPAVQPAVEANAAEEEEEEERGGEEEEPMLAPRVKVAEDGSLIIDEESLTVQVLRMKGPNPVAERDPIFERGSTTTYSSFRKGTYTKPWSNRETDMFFLAISMVGTDFSMIGQLFPHRARIEIKNKFKKEERANSWRIDKAFKEKRRLDLNFFNKLLEQILKVEEEKRKQRKHGSRMARIPRRRPGERKRKICSSDSEEDKSSSSDAMEGEKENDNVCNDGGNSATPKRKRGRASQKRRKHTNQSAEQEAEQEEAERSANEESSPVNELDCVEGETELFGVKPVVRRWRNRGPVGQRKSPDTHASAREESANASASNDSESEEEPDLTAIQEHILNKPTRSGRIPKLSQHMIRAAADEEEDEEEEQLPPLPLPPDAQPRGSQAKPGRWRNPRRGKSKLLTLRASATEEDQDEEEEEYGTNQEEENYSPNAEEENQAFVPMGLRSVMAVQSEVEETMEELDISVNVPDVLGISQNAVCPESSCERALAPMGPVPCEHQLDLLVDVIEFLAPDHMEVSEEAARTLLTIGHSAHMTQTGEPSSTGDVIIVEESLSQVHEELMETMETRVETCEMVTSDPSSSIISETNPVSTVSTGDKTPPPDSASTAEPKAPPPPQDFASTAEPKAPPPPQDSASTAEPKAPPPPQDSASTAEPKAPPPPQDSASTAEPKAPPPPQDSASTAEPKAPPPPQDSASTAEPKAPPPPQDFASTAEPKAPPPPQDSASTAEPKTPPPPQDSASTAEPANSQESKVLSSEIQPETLSIIVPEPTASKTRRNHLPKPKPNLSRVYRTMQREPAEAVTSSAETFSAPVKALIEAKTVESQISTVKDFIPEAPSHPQPKEQMSEICEERENDKTEECSPVLSLEKKMEDGVAGKRICIEDERREETQQTHSESKSRSSGSEFSVKPSPPVRRCRGPKPKPNLVRSIRTTHTVTHIQQNHPGVPSEVQASANTFPDIQQPEEGANVIPEPEREPPNDAVMMIPDANPEELPGSVCESSDEPMFVLSLTEVPSTHAEGAGLVTDSPPLPATSGSISEPISVSENASINVGATGPGGDQVFSHVLHNALVPVSEEQETESRENEMNRGKEEESSGQLRRRERSPLTRNTAAPEGPDEAPVEHLHRPSSSSSCKSEGNVEEADLSAKRRNLPERGRRAKLQIKPNPIQRKTCRDLSSSDETRPAPTSSCEMTSEETEPQQMSSKIISSLASAEEASSSEAASSSAILDKNNKTSTALTEQSPVTSPPPVRIETPPPQASPSSSPPPPPPSQGIVGNIILSGTDPVEPSASGVEAGSQPVHQITPLASTGPQTRLGRRPKGFLSFMSCTSTQRPSESTRAPQKPAVITSRTERSRAAPSTSASPPHTSSHPQAETSRVNPSAAEEDKEPTSVAAYFFNDIFTVVDEQDELD